MMTESRDALAMQMHTAVDTLIQRPSIDAYNRMSKMLASMKYSGLSAECLDAATEILNGVCDRYERMQKIGLSDKEAENLCAMVGELDWLLSKIPVNVFKASVAAVHHNFEAMHEEPAC